jgi:hypothetical protein
MGKTVCLRLINALFKRDYLYMVSVPFKELVYEFSSGEVVSITKAPIEVEEGEQAKLPLILKLSPARKPTWQPTVRTIGTGQAVSEPFLPWLTRVSPFEWMDERTGESLDVDGLVKRYENRLPPEFLAQFHHADPNEFVELILRVDCHLVETQRLLVMPAAEFRDRRSRDRRYEADPREAGTETRLVVNQKAQILKDKLRDKLAEYANTSQEQDREFPKRVIEGPHELDFTTSELRDRLKNLSEKREALIKAGILNTPLRLGPDTLVSDTIEQPIAKVLEIYVKNNEVKLQLFNELLEQLQLFESLINERFGFKRLEIEANDGFRITSAKGQTLPLNCLSSGEQHQLILFFELIFELEEKSLILIDEPELSLHVAWQRKFIDDLMRIIGVNPFDVLLATHSPQLIDEWWDDLIVELGSVE